MKTIWSIILVGIFFLNILGCEKPKPNTINQSVFIGKWRELSPCVAGTGSCFAVQFNVNGTYFESSPAVDTGTFALTNNSASIALTGGIGTGTYGFQFMNNDSELIIQKIYTGFYPDTPLFHKDVILNFEKSSLIFANTNTLSSESQKAVFVLQLLCDIV